MNDYLNQIRNMIFYSPEGGGGDGDETPNIVKFGGIEVNLDAEPEVLAAKMAEAQKAYVASSDAGIKSAQALKTTNAEFEKFKKENVVPPVGNEGMKTMMEEMFKTEMAGIKAVEAKGRELNLNRTIETKNKELRKDFNMLNDDDFKTAMEESTKVWNKQDPASRTGGMYQTIANLTLGKALQKNVVKIQDDVAYETMMKNPEQAKKFIADYAKKVGIDINMDAAIGIVNQENFTTEYEKKTKEFKNETDSEKRKRLAMDIANMRKTGKAAGYSYDKN